MPRPASKDHYTFADCLIWGKDERIEIINGEAVMMAPPTRIHQEILMELSRQLARACLKIGDVSSSEGFWAAGKQFFRRNPGGFQGKIAPSRGQKPRRLGMLTFFKQALVLHQVRK